MASSVHDIQGQFPKEIADQHSAIAAQAARNRTAAFDPYGKPRVAPMPHDLEMAHKLGRDHGGWQNYIKGAHEMIGRATGPEASFPDQYHRYANPFEDHAIKGFRRRSAETFNEDILPKLESQFVRAGHHGSSRHAHLATRAATLAQREMMEREGDMRARNYEHSGNMHARDMERRLLASRELAGLSSDYQRSRLGDIGALENQGMAQHSHHQEQLDKNYQEWLFQHEYPHLSLAREAAILHGLPFSTVNSQYSLPYAQPTLNRAGQLGALATSLFGHLHERRR